MERLNETEIHRIRTFFQGLGINQLANYQKVCDELPVLKNLLECITKKCAELDAKIESIRINWSTFNKLYDRVTALETQCKKIPDLEKQVKDLREILDKLITKW